MTTRQHLHKNLLLAAPVMLTQAGQILVNVVDNVMVGGLGGDLDSVKNPELGKLALGAVSLGNAVFFTFFVAALGFSFSMSPLVAQADAKSNYLRGAKILSHGLVLNMVLSVLVFAFLWFGVPLLSSPLLKQSPQVVTLATPYLQIIALSLIPLMIFQSFRQLSEGLSLTLIVTIATFIANLLNVFLNYGFIYGNWGFPRLEVEGAAYGTLISRVVMIFTLVGAMWLYPKSRKYLSLVQFKTFQKTLFQKLIQLGAPTSFQMFFEVGAFASAAFICGMASEDDLAAHQIALNLASITFMLCTGLSIAATVRVGNQMAFKDKTALNKAAWSAIAMVTVFMLFCGVIFVVFRNFLPELYIDNQEVVALAAQLMLVAALFQLFDGVQVVTLGALRGMQDVWVPMLITLLAYFVLTIPLGYFLTIRAEMGALGMWIALGVGLAISATLLLWRFISKTRQLNF